MVGLISGVLVSLLVIWELLWVQTGSGVWRIVFGMVMAWHGMVCCHFWMNSFHGTSNGS